MSKKDSKFQIYSLADLPYGVKSVNIAIVHGARRSVHDALFSHDGKVYGKSWRVGDVRDQPKMFTAFRQLTGMKDRELREARKQWLVDQVKERQSQRMATLKRQASRAGYRLVKE